VAGCFVSPLCSPCFTHEFGELAVEPQWILKKGCVSGFGVPGRGTGPTFFMASYDGSALSGVVTIGDFAARRIDLD
jgi:hypothetical protein